MNKIIISISLLFLFCFVNAQIVEFVNYIPRCDNSGLGQSITFILDSDFVPFEVQWYNETTGQMGEVVVEEDEYFVITGLDPGLVRLRAFINDGESGSICYTDYYREVGGAEPNFEVFVKDYQTSSCGTGMIELDMEYTSRGEFPPYTVTWGHGDTGWRIEGLDPGTYCYTVTDTRWEYDCSYSDCVELFVVEDFDFEVSAECPNGTMREKEIQGRVKFGSKYIATLPAVDNSKRGSVIAHDVGYGIFSWFHPSSAKLVSEQAEFEKFIKDYNSVVDPNNIMFDDSSNPRPNIQIQCDAALKAISRA